MVLHQRYRHFVKRTMAGNYITSGSGRRNRQHTVVGNNRQLPRLRGNTRSVSGSSEDFNQ
jgi:hypothetical protein